MAGMVDKASVAKQYATADNLALRIAFQQRFSQNKYGFGPWLMDRYDFPPHARVLEIGCGTGAMWQGRQALIDSFDSLILTDFSEGMLADAQKNLADINGVVFQQADIQNLPFEADSFDFVIANMMLYHVSDKERAVREVRRVLKKGGVFACATYGEEGLPSYMQRLLGDRVAFRSLNKTFTLQNGADILKIAFENAEKCEYPDEFLVDDADAVVAYLASMTGMVTGFPAEEVRAIVAEKIAAEGPMHIPKQYGTFICH